MIVEAEDPANMVKEVADQLFMNDKGEQLVERATKMKSNWRTFLASKTIFPSQPNFLQFLFRSPAQKAYLIFVNKGVYLRQNGQNEPI